MNLYRLKVKWDYFHAKRKDRSEIQKKWMNNEILIIVATIAFGMGINKKDVRYVIHTRFPQSIEAYSQECGRAGRDGNPAHWVLFYQYSDRSKIDFLMMNSAKQNSVRKLY